MEDEQVSTFVNITGAETDVALHYLEASGWALERAVDHFMENSGGTHELPSHHQSGPLQATEDTSGVLGDTEVVSQEEFVDAREDELSGGELSDPEEIEEEVRITPVAQPRDVDLPDGVSMHEFRESRMLERTFYDVPMEDNLEDLLAEPRNLAQRPPSPSTLAARELRQQQDAEFEESQRRDREKHQAEEEERRKAREEAIAEEYRKNQEAEEIERVLKSKAESLLPEPSESDLDSIIVSIRFPDGANCRRRFLRSDPTSCLFAFVDVHMNQQVASLQGSGSNGQCSLWWKVGGYNLVTQFPRKVLQEETQLTLQDAGLISKQEALFVELK